MPEPGSSWCGLFLPVASLLHFPTQLFQKWLQYLTKGSFSDICSTLLAVHERECQERDDVEVDVEGQQDAYRFWDAYVKLVVLQDWVPRGSRLAAEAGCQRLLCQ